MIYILGNQFFKSAMSIDEIVPKEVSEVINQTLSIYEDSYNCNSIPFQSGGYCVIIMSHDMKLYHDFLNMYNISSELAEFQDVICEENGFQWKSEYYQLSTEYGIFVIFYEPKGVSE